MAYLGHGSECTVWLVFPLHGGYIAFTSMVPIVQLVGRVVFSSSCMRWPESLMYDL